MAGLWNQREAYLKEFVTCSARRAVAAQRRLSQASASKSLVSIMWCFQRNLATTELNHRVRSPLYKEIQISWKVVAPRLIAELRGPQPTVARPPNRFPEPRQVGYVMAVCCIGILDGLVSLYDT